MTVSVSLSVREHISRTTVRSSPNFYPYYLYVRGSVVLWRRCDMLCTSSFMDDIIFAHIQECQCNTGTASQPASQPVGASGRLGLPRPLVVAETANW